jgi:chromosome segregation ATPase
LSAKIRTVVSEQEALLIKAVEGMKQKALEAAETRLEEYRAAQDGEFRHLEALAEDNRRLDNELRQKMMQDWEARDKSFQEGWKKDIQELKALAEETEKQVSSGAGVLEKRLEDLKAKTGTVVSEQEALLFKTVEEMNQKVLEAARIRLEEYRAAQEGEFKRLEALAEENRRLDDELRRNMLQDWEARDRSFQEGWKKDIQELKALAEETEKRVSSGAGALEERLEDLKAKTGTVVSEQEALLFKTVEGMKQKALESAETRLEEYRAAQEGEFKRLEALAEDSRRLDIELRRSMQEIAGRVKDDFSLFERESSDAREKTAAEFAAAVKSLKSSMEELEKDLNTLKASAWENVSEKLGGFVDEFAVDLAKRSGDIDRRLNEWQERIEARLGELGSQGEEKRRELEKSLTEDLRKRLTEQNERIVAELDRLKTEAAAFEESIRGRMNAADDFLLSYKDDMERNLEGARKDAELSIKSEISRYALSTADTIRQNQRDLEEKLREIGGYVESRNTELTGLMETSREHAAGLEGRIAALRSSLEETYREADSRRAEILSRSEEQVRVLDSSIRDAERHIREFFDQTKLIDQADELRVDMERRIEDLRSEIDGLDQRRAEAAQLESEFVKIRRLEDEVNAKMTRFLTEKHRMDKMEEDFARLLQTDKAVQEKLVHVTNAGDSLQEMQIKIRRIEDALAAAEEKYQRIEKKNQVLDNTNDGIDRNFKALQESEGRLQKASEELERLNGGIESIRAVIETLATENEKARETADQISLLDKALSEIEERTRAMQVAREWIARTESRMEELNRQTQEQVRLMGNILKSEGIKRGPRERGAPPVGDRENIIKLARQGWTIEEIAKNMKISQGEVELILELAPKD